jgi:hypothetical protein
MNAQCTSLYRNINTSLLWEEAFGTMCTVLNTFDHANLLELFIFITYFSIIVPLKTCEWDDGGKIGNKNK